MPALTSGRYRIKWTRLTDVPVPLFYPYVVVQDKKVYVAGHATPVKDAENQVYVYDLNTDQWGRLPPPGHCYGIPHIIGGKLAIIGGRLSSTEKVTNKVSTFDEDSQTWTSYYPNLLTVRSKPGVVSHLEHVIVAGGGLDDITHDDIEVLNWIENSQWIRVSIKLPVPMWGFIPTISDDNLLIVGYDDADMKAVVNAYKIPVAHVTVLTDKQHNRSMDTHSKWTELTANNHWCTTLIPNSSPPVIVGGQDRGGTQTTADIKMYNYSSRSWEKIESLSFGRTCVGVSTVNDNAIVIIGGCTKGGSTAKCKSSSLRVVELGQAELIH